MENQKSKIQIVSLILSGLSLVMVIVLTVLFFVNPFSKTAEPNQWKLYVGTSDKETYLPMDKDVARGKVDATCTSHFADGYTLFEATGAWKEETGDITHEYTFVCYVGNVSKQTVYACVDELLLEIRRTPSSSNPIAMPSTSIPAKWPN